MNNKKSKNILKISKHIIINLNRSKNMSNNLTFKSAEFSQTEKAAIINSQFSPKQHLTQDTFKVVASLKKTITSPTYSIDSKTFIDFVNFELQDGNKMNKYLFQTANNRSITNSFYPFKNLNYIIPEVDISLDKDGYKVNKFKYSLKDYPKLTAIIDSYLAENKADIHKIDLNVHFLCMRLKPVTGSANTDIKLNYTGKSGLSTVPSSLQKNVVTHKPVPEIIPMQQSIILSSDDKINYEILGDFTDELAGLFEGTFADCEILENSFVILEININSYKGSLQTYPLNSLRKLVSADFLKSENTINYSTGYFASSIKR